VVQKIDHPHIGRVFAIEEDSKNYFIVMEYLSGGNLLEVIGKEGKISYQRVHKVVHDLLLALNYMHKQNIMHRDLKLENVMLTHSGEIKLVDFGFATCFKQEESLSLGSPLYMAPELHLSKAYTEKVDVWSLGVITAILLIGDVPFGGKNESEIVRQIVSHGCDFTKS
jgi:serine/threonine protein kinase